MNGDGATNLLMSLVRAEVEAGVRTVEAEILTRPSLIKTDGDELTYACTVKITGHDNFLENVPIAVAASALEYSDVGAAVTLRKDTETGKFEIVGFSKKKPGRRVLIAVDVEAQTLGLVQDVSVTSRLLTLGELGDTLYGGGWGQTPLGATAIFRGETLIEVRT